MPQNITKIQTIRRSNEYPQYIHLINKQSDNCMNKSIIYYLVSFPDRKFQKLLRNYSAYCQNNWPQVVTVTATHYLQFSVFSEMKSLSLLIRDTEYNMGRT